jgi:Uma2 family endonuclease
MGRVLTDHATKPSFVGQETDLNNLSGEKALAYARAEIQEYWVLDIEVAKVTSVSSTR